MATVQSLGIHEPTALPYLIEEQLVPPQDAESHYKWDVVADSPGSRSGAHSGPPNTNDDGGTDELLITRDSVVWARGCTFRKCFRFDLEKEPVTHALLARFPVSADSQESSAQKTKKPQKSIPDRRSLSKALVVFLRTQAHIFFLDGTSHVVHMPFEVESACAAPRGIIIQRKLRLDNAAPVTLKFPRVPPNSFVSSQLSNASATHAQLAFSTEGMGKPKTLPLRLSTSVGHMWESPVVHADSHWPRLVCLSDPLLEMGLVVTQAEPPAKPRRRYSGKGPFFLDPAEEILHIESLDTPDRSSDSEDDIVTVAVTLNRDANTYTVWKLSYLAPDDTPFTRPKKPAPKPNKRRSSMQPGILSGTTTPIQPKFRESFGAPMPGKRPVRRSERHEKPVDIASTIQADKDGGVARRQSRRVSSMVARIGDLSASHDRSKFDGAKRVESHGSQYARQSSGIHGSFSMGGLNPTQTHLEAPVDDLLDELRSGGDFEGFHTMGLEDHDFEGLTHEILFSKIHSVSIETSSVRYSTSTQPAKGQCKVFVLVGPPFAIDEHQRNQVLISIQDPVDKRLQLLTFHLQRQRKFDLKQTSKPSPSSQAETTTLTWSHLRKAQDVIDSCKIVDGDLSMILILSRGHAGHELSIQAPWSKLTSISIPSLLQRNPNGVSSSPLYLGLAEGAVSQTSVQVTSSNIVEVANSIAQGVVDVRDHNGKYHQLRIQLQPTSLPVKKVLEACRSVLPASHAEQVVAGWWSIMQWLRAENAPFPDYEWSCAVVLLFVMYLGLGCTESSTLTNVPKRNLYGDIFASFTLDGGDDIGDWDKMQTFETPNSSACPAWMQGRAWEWMLCDDGDMSIGGDASQPSKTDFVSRHIQYAKQFMVSASGVEAIGTAGYLPTAVGRGKETRRSAGWAMFLALHALMEDQKLDIMMPEYQSPGRADLRVVMCQIARWLKWPVFGSLYELGIQADLDPCHDDELSLSPPIPEPSTQFCIFAWIQANLAHQVPAVFMTLSRVYYTGSQISEEEQARDRRWDSITPRTFMFQSLFAKFDHVRKAGSPVGPLQVVKYLHDCGFTQRVLDTLPEAVLAPLRDAIAQVQARPMNTWPRDLLELINRSDVSMMLESEKPARRSATTILAPTHTATWDYSVLCRSVDEFTNVGYNEDGGVERQAVIRALFKDDRRLDEAKNILSTSRSRLVHLEPDPQWSESQYLEKQKELATRIAVGTLAIPSGRGLLFYSLRFPLLTQKYAIQGFNLNCIVRPTNTTVGVDKSLYAEEKVSWAFFHQGVAGGLAISPQAKGIDTSWILYNKPGQDLSNRHAGFLLALGLNGHLKSVAKWVAFKYLTPKHTMTSIGLLLGLAASYLGTMDSLITRLLSVHVTRMLPRGAAELNLSPLTQTTGILGIGLLYANTQHRRMSEIMVSEIAHVDAEEEEEPLRSECYRLAAGFALGLINLARGEDLRGLSDMRLTESLLSLATSTKKVDVVQILDRAAAPATVAIALIVMRTEDQIVARKIDVPDSVLQFEYIRPDVLLLRTLAKNLIMWSKIEPSFRWVRLSLPQEYQARHRLGAVQKLDSGDLSFFAILAGLCFSMALKYSGSADVRVRDLLVHYLDQFRRISKLPAPGFDAKLARGGTAMALDTLALSAAIVMAGTGDLVVLRRLRALHGREDKVTTYGSHLAAHLATGALFLGSGTKTFGTSPMSTAALIMAFYPVWPGNVMDNRAHLQAARHFWTLAVEERCLVAREVGGGVVSVGVIIKMRKPQPPKQEEESKPLAAPARPPHRSAISALSSQTLPTIEGTPVTPIRSPGAATTPPPIEAEEEECEPEVLRLTTPTLLPPLETISSIQTVAGPTFWNLTLDFDTTKGLRERFSAGGMNMYLRRRPGVEGVLEGTIRALGSKNKVPAGSASDPLEWMFNLEALEGLTAMERNVVLGTGEEGDGDLGGGGGSGSGSLAQAVDSRLVLKEAAGGKSRDDLLGLKLLFAWETEREKRLKATATTLSGQHFGNGCERKKATPRLSDGGDVMMGEDGDSEGKRSPVEPIEEDEPGDWWLRSTVVDEIKGKVFLGEQV